MFSDRSSILLISIYEGPAGSFFIAKRRIELRRHEPKVRTFSERSNRECGEAPSEREPGWGRGPQPDSPQLGDLSLRVRATAHNQRDGEAAGRSPVRPAAEREPKATRDAQQATAKTDFR